MSGYSEMIFERKQISAIWKKIYFICKWHRSTEAGHGVQELPQTREKQDLHSYFQTSLPESVNPCSIPDLKYQVMANTLHAKEKKQAGIP